MGHGSRPKEQASAASQSWLALAMRPDIMGRGRKVALIVGTILTAINQGDVILNGTLTVATLGKILLTYCVPYCVSTYAGVAAIRDRLR